MAKDIIVEINDKGVDSYIKKIIQAGKSTKEAAKSVDDLNDSLDETGKEAKGVDKLAKSVNKLDKELSETKKQSDKTFDTTKIKRYDNQLNKANSTVNKSLSGIKKLGGALAAAFATAQISQFIVKSTELYDIQQKAESKLLTALKGREDIQKRLIAQAQSVQQRSLFGDEEIIQQQAFLAALGLTEEQINNVIDAAIDLSAGENMALDSSVKNLAKTYSGLTGELGEVVLPLRDLTKEQLQNGEAVKVVSELYKGQAEVLRNSGLGAFQAFQNTVGDLREELGGLVVRVLTPVLTKLITLVEIISKLPQFFRENATAIKLLGVALLGLRLNVIVSQLATLSLGFVSWAKNISLVTKATRTATIAQRLFNTAVASNPIGLMITALSAAAAAFIIFRNRTKEAKDELKEFGNEIEDISIKAGEQVFLRMSKDASGLNEVIEKLIKNSSKLTKGELQSLKMFLENELSVKMREASNETDELSKSILDVDIKDYQRGLASVVEELKKYNIEIEVSSEKTSKFATGSIAALNEALSKARKELEEANDIEAFGTAINKIKELEDKLYSAQSRIESIGEILEDDLIGEDFSPEPIEVPLELKDLDDIDMPEIDFSSVENETDDFWESFEERSKEAAEKARDEMIENISSTIGFAGEFGNEIFNMLSASNEAEEQMLQDRLDKGLISEKQYAKEVAKIKTREARADKAQAMFNIGIKTAEGIVSALGNPIKIALVSAIGAAQLAFVAAQPIPKFKDGVKGFEGGLAVVGDGGKREPITDKDGNVIGVSSDKPSLVNLPKGANVYPSEDSFISEMLKNNVPIQYNYNSLHDNFKVPNLSIGSIVKDKIKAEAIRNSLGGINLNPLIDSSDQSRLYLGKKLDKQQKTLELIALNTIKGGDNARV